jgi:hypothetical protein
MSLLTNSKNLVLNIRCEVTSKIIQTKNSNLKNISQVSIIIDNPGDQEPFPLPVSVTDDFDVKYHSDSEDDCILLEHRQRVPKAHENSGNGGKI